MSYIAFKNISLDLHKSDFEGNIETEYEQKFSSLGFPIYRLEAYIKESENRANSIHRANNLLKKKLYDLKGIKKVKVKEHYRRVNGGNCKEQLSMLH